MHDGNMLITQTWFVLWFASFRQGHPRSTDSGWMPKESASRLSARGCRSCTHLPAGSGVLFDTSVNVWEKPILHSWKPDSSWTWICTAVQRRFWNSITTPSTMNQPISKMELGILLTLWEDMCSLICRIAEAMQGLAWSFLYVSWEVFFWCSNVALLMC